MGDAPWEGKDYVRSGPDYPAVHISWVDAQAFLHRLNQREGMTLYRLPTEAEWEYACRAGTPTLWHFGNQVIQVDIQEGHFQHMVDPAGSPIVDHAWFFDNAFAGGYARPVGQKAPNPWGLYDLYGNVAEMVQDYYSPTYYAVSPERDPPGPPSGTARVVRGGGFNGTWSFVRSASRSPRGEQIQSGTVGVRLVRIR